MTTPKDGGTRIVILWNETQKALPPEETRVLTKVEKVWGVEKEQVLVRIGSQWFKSDDRSMPVNYTPTHWVILP